MSFKGIPYAMPPVGDLRWRAPVAPKPWKSVLIADHFAPDCMQILFKRDDAPPQTHPSEDCLYLNVWRPAASIAKKLPVMVWIYGGGFVNGGSSPKIYDGSAFARSGVILISFNYRMGHFGFFAHPALTQEANGGPTSNFGLLDQIAALKWVQRNVADFGGDPANVTIFGQSAGGGSVHLLMMEPQARGLFAKAIVESGGGRTDVRGMKTQAQAEAIGVEFAKAHGISATDAEGLRQLRDLPATAITDNLYMMTLHSQTDFSGPIMDGQLVKMPIDSAYENGDVARVPMIVGTNDADGLFFSDDINAAYAPVGSHRTQAEAIYDPEGKHDARRIGADIWADVMMLEPARNISRAATALHVPVYAYRFTYVAQFLRSQLPGALHASEIPFVFQTVGARYGDMVQAPDLQEAKLIHAYWVAFAKTGQPAVPGQPEWDRYDPALDQVFLFGQSTVEMKEDPARKRLNFIESLVSRR
jgi:para-nitrobenzyl esterase